MECDDLIVYLEQPEDLQAIIEVPDDITVNTIESVREVEVPQEMTYTIDFDADSTQWGFHSKHFGNITSVELTNVASYTIDGAAVTLPKAIELNTTYIIDIVKETSGTAQMIISVMPIDYAEIDSTVDNTTGDGSYLYLLGNNTDIITNRKLLKFDSNLLNLSNSLGGGSWSTNPLLSTITLPLLPTGGYWKLICYVRSDHLIIIGAKASPKALYICKVDSYGNVTDLNGNVDAFSSFTIGIWGDAIFCAYDYNHNYLYIHTYPDNSNRLCMIELDNNTFHPYTEYNTNGLSFGYYSGKTVPSFNPYRNSFFTSWECDVENAKMLLYPYHPFATFAGKYSILRKKYIKTNYTRLLYVFNEYGYLEKSFISSPSQTVNCYTLAYDEIDDVIVANGPSLYFGIYRITDNNIRHYLLSNPEVSETHLQNSTFLKDNLYAILSNAYGRIHLIDASDPSGTAVPDFNYYDLPCKCWYLCSNRLI